MTHEQPADALRAGRRAVALLPLSSDAAWAPFIQTYLAQIYLLNGDLDNTVAYPPWAPLRGHPGFAALVATP